MKKNKKYVALVSCVSVLLVVFGVLYFTTNRPVEQLSEAAIADLRGKYPIKEEMPSCLEMVPHTVEEVKQSSETFVYGEIEGEIHWYSDTVSLEDEELEKKREENGISNDYEYFEYTISVIKDTEEIFIGN